MAEPYGITEAGLKAAVDRMERGYANAADLQRKYDRRQILNRHAPEILRAANAFLSAFGGDVPDWLRPEWDALAKACADAEGFPKE